jgi:hypothetical protein
MRTHVRWTTNLLVACAAATMLLLNASASFAETWSGNGTWKSDRFAAAGTWSVDASRKGDGLDGGIALTGSPVFTGGSITSMITDGNTVTFGVLQNGTEAATFTGRLTGTSVTGTYQSSADTGTWKGTLTLRP